MSQTRAQAPSKTIFEPEANLSKRTAIWDALFWRSIDRYPLIVNDGQIATLDAGAVAKEIARTTNDWAGLDDKGLDKALELARQSLNEVKAQTEYQDQKATRLLTITTVLTAMSGLLFTRFQDAYSLTLLSLFAHWQVALLAACYVFFSLFVMTALFGALATFHATRTRFKYPSSQDPEGQERDPTSLLFYAGLIRVRPSAWAKAWAASDTDGTNVTVRTDLRQRYLQNLVTETYLIAAKTADKLRYLEPAQNLLAISLRCLFVFLVLLGSIYLGVAPIKAPALPSDAKPTVSTVTTPPAPPTPSAVCPSMTAPSKPEVKSPEVGARKK